MFEAFSVSPRELVVVTVDGREEGQERFDEVFGRLDPGFFGWPDYFLSPVTRPMSLAEAGDLLKMNETFEQSQSARKALASL